MGGGRGRKEKGKEKTVGKMRGEKEKKKKQTGKKKKIKKGKKKKGGGVRRGTLYFRKLGQAEKLNLTQKLNVEEKSGSRCTQMKTMEATTPDQQGKLTESQPILDQTLPTPKSEGLVMNLSS